MNQYSSIASHVEPKPGETKTEYIHGQATANDNKEFFLSVVNAAAAAMGSELFYKLRNGT